MELPDILDTIGDDDADGDGVTNLAELTRGTSPSVADRRSDTNTLGLSNPRYAIGSFDPRFAYRRLSGLYCGQSPSFEEMQSMTGDAEAMKRRLHEKLSACLASLYWRDEGLIRLAELAPSCPGAGPRDTT
jgi:hypothetical protein